MGGKKTVAEMMGEVHRDVAILVSVFYTLDAYLGCKPDVSLPVTFAVLAGCIAALSIGVLLEYYRERDVSER
jgi:hypothetical protein